MTHKREHYETVLKSIIKNSSWVQGAIALLSPYHLMVEINAALLANDCIPYTQNELYTIAEEMI